MWEGCLWDAGWGRCVQIKHKALFESHLSRKLVGIFESRGSIKSQTYGAATGTVLLACSARPEHSPKWVCGEMCPHGGVAPALTRLTPSPQGVTDPSSTGPFPLERPLTHWGFPSHRAVKGKLCAAAARLWAGPWFPCIWLCRGNTAAPANEIEPLLPPTSSFG